MSIKKQHNYPNGAKLLIFDGGGIKYIPSPAYTAHVEKLKVTPRAEKTNSTAKNVSKLIDTLFKVAPNDPPQTALCKETFSVLKKDNTSKEQRAVIRTHAPNHLKLAR